MRRDRAFREGMRIRRRSGSEPRGSERDISEQHGVVDLAGQRQRAEQLLWGVGVSRGGGRLTLEQGRPGPFESSLSVAEARARSGCCRERSVVASLRERQTSLREAEQSLEAPVQPRVFGDECGGLLQPALGHGVDRRDAPRSQPGSGPS